MISHKILDKEGDVPLHINFNCLKPPFKSKGLVYIDDQIQTSYYQIVKNKCEY